MCVLSEASPQQEHEEDSAEEDAERAHCGNYNLRHHLHVTYQGIWNAGVRAMWNVCKSTCTV